MLADPAPSARCTERGIGDHDCAEHDDNWPPPAPSARDRATEVGANAMLEGGWIGYSDEGDGAFDVAGTVVDALLSAPEVLSVLAGETLAPPRALPSREQIAKVAHDALFCTEPVPGEPWVNSWLVVADAVLALLGAAPTLTERETGRA